MTIIPVNDPSGADATFLPEVVVQFGTRVAGKSFDSRLREALEENIETANQPRVCILDFRETEWIDIGSSQSITSFYIAAKKKNWLVVIRPPAEKETRDFWRLWQFPDAFEAATNISFSRLIAGDDRKFINEKQTTFNPTSVLRIHDPLNSDSKRSSNFFGFCSDSISGTNFSHVAGIQADKWTLSDVQNILMKHIGGRCDYIPTRVVFEAVFNATKHPGATIDQSASYHHKFASAKTTSARKRDSDFNILFWDNGKSMLSTTNSAIAKGVNLKHHYLSDFKKSYDVTYQILDSGSETRETVSSDIEINEKLPSYIRLLSTLFPGVTSRPEIESLESVNPHSVHPEVVNFDERFARRGMGLFVLVNAVADVLDGSVSFRTGKFYMHIAKNKPRTAKLTGAHFQVQIVETPESVPEFEGNMITVRIPTEKTKNDVVGVANPV